MTDQTTPAARPLPADVAGLVERATAALDGVTPGPWQVRTTDFPYAPQPEYGFPGGVMQRYEIETEWEDGQAKDRIGVVAVSTDPRMLWLLEDDARFIAAARQLVPDLTAALEAQAAQIADLTAERDDLIATCDMMGNLWAMEKARVRTSPYACAAEKGGDNG